MMGSSHLDQAEKSSPETFSDSSVSPDSPDTNDIFGDPSVHPRVGDEYQAEIPSLLSESELLHLLGKHPADPKGIVDSSHSFFMGLPIPLMWVRNQLNPIKTERFEYHDDLYADDANGLMGPKNLATSVSNGNWLIPDRQTELWTDFEADCFLLGLYLLGKNLLQVRRFVESKGLGQVLAYYYGQFYGSSGYSRWSENRKMRSRKCVVGHKFFTGYRQQELFSRLYPCVSEESKSKLVEASRGFAEGRSSLDEYVFTLKSLVGIRALVDAVEIGKGKDDLTTLIFEGPKSNQIFSHRPEVPSGKAWSSLTCAEIVKYLTGDFRLSKSRSNDLFWEAVWPRLLARGWRSEQPKGDKHIVFLIPGIKKFSRRKLSKGDHYFDSVSDVLAKVASEPKLLELDSDGDTQSCSKVENGWAPEVQTEDEYDSSDHERRCYLKPRVSLRNSDHTVFTVVDTSLADDDNPYKVRELRCLSEEATSSLTFSCGMTKKETKLQVDGNPISNGLQSSSFPSDTIGSQRIPNGSLNLPMNHKSRTIKNQFSQRVKSGLSGCVGPVTKRRKISSCVDLDATFVVSLPARNKNATLKIVGPKLTLADVKAEVIHSEKGFQDNLNGNHVELDMTPENEKMSISHKGEKAPDLKLPRVCTKPVSDAKIKLEKEVSTFHQISNVDYEKLKSFDIDGKRLSDSEIPMSFNTENLNQFVGCEDRVSLPYIMDYQMTSTSGEPSKDIPHTVFEIAGPSDVEEPRVISVSVEYPNKVEKSNQHPRRQSTRNRPLTTKALEALEIGLLSPVRTYKKRSSSVDQDQMPKRARKSRNQSPMVLHDYGF